MSSLSGGPKELVSLATPLTELAAEAGRLILSLSKTGFEVHSKADASPVTNADVQAEEMLMRGLALILPGVPVLAEESASRGEYAETQGTFLVIDPLDGTREYVAGRPEYTVNIGLVIAGRPALGILAVPALGRFYWGVPGGGAQRALAEPGTLPERHDYTPIATRSLPPSPVALTSRGYNDPMTEAFLDMMAIEKRERLGSAYKFGLVAEGSADLYVRFGPTMEWDTAAGEALVVAAGGAVLTPEGELLGYGKIEQDFRNGPFVVWGKSPR